jgi:type I restriction enzyme S subunit
MQMPQISIPDTDKFCIPIPPLHVQTEIVRILDNFTELTAEHTAELHSRKKQYTYYRDKLLTFEDGQVEWKTLGEVVVRAKGTQITAAQMKILDKPNAPVKIFAGGKTIAYFEYDDLPQKDINTFPSIIVKSRGVIEFEYYDKPFSHKNEMWSYHSEQIAINIKFIYYFLKTQEEQLRNKATSMGAFPQIAIPDTEKIKIPLPSREEQARIVSILDKFDALTTSMTEGLPREIELRQKQYEYYRNLLLTFPKAEA